MIYNLIFAGGATALVTPELGLLFWTSFIFLTFWFLLSRFAFKPIANALKNREDGINESLAAAERAKEEMAALTAENEKILQEAREERAKILSDAKEQRDKYLAEERDKTKQEIGRMMDNAKAEIQSQKNTALAEVKNQVGLIALEMAEKVLGRELNSKTEHESFVSDLVNKIDLN